MVASVAVFLVYNLIPIKDGIDYPAHIGGLLAGIAFGYLSIPGLVRLHNKALRFGSIVVMALLVAGMTYIFSKTATDDVGSYESKIGDFVEMEAMANEVYGHLPYIAKRIGNKKHLLLERKSAPGRGSGRSRAPG